MLYNINILLLEGKMLNTIKEIYSASATDVVVLDAVGRLLWTNTQKMSIYVENDMSFLFENDLIPEKSCVCNGVRDGIPYQYNVIVTGEYRIVEIINENAALDFMKIKTIRDNYENNSANVRNYIHNISTPITAILGTLKEETNSYEISCLKEQMRGCYSVLRLTTYGTELVEYASGNTQSSVISLKNFFSSIQSELDRWNTDACLNVGCEDDLFISANEDRLLQALLSVVVLEINQASAGVSVEIWAKRYKEDIIIEIFGVDGDDDKHIIDYSASRDNSDIDNKPELLIMRIFCQTYGGRLLIGKSRGGYYSVGAVLPTAEKPDEEQLLRSPKAQIITDEKFSPLRIALAEWFE